MSEKKIRSALVSVYHKEGLQPIVEKLNQLGVEIYSTGGTQSYLEGLNIPVIPVESLTQYPSIFGGRVKTLHPKIFGGILYRRGEEKDKAEAAEYNIPDVDLVIVDLYPFEETVAQGAGHDDIIEKIDIGGISLIRAAAKNYNDVLIVSSREQYEDTLDLLNRHSGVSTLEDRRRYAAFAFDISSHYDSAIFNYMNQGVDIPSFKNSTRGGSALRYGENPHQRGWYYGNFSAYFSQINGKELSYNNLVDIDAAVSLVEEFEETTFVIIKHTNACGVANGATVKEAYLKALEADSVSAFGGILATNKEVDIEAAEEINKLFFEVLITPSVTKEAEVLLKSKKNRIILIQQKQLKEVIQFKSLMNGVLVQDKDIKTDNREDLKVVTRIAPSNDEIEALLFASKICKHSKSNTIVLAKKGQLLASGVGQTSRVDALNQAIEKAKAFGMNIEGSVMASDAFFPFPDCVEIGYNVGVKTVIQPGGSIKDQDSIDYCDKNGMAMVFSGHRHFLH